MDSFALMLYFHIEYYDDFSFYCETNRGCCRISLGNTDIPARL